MADEWDGILKEAFGRSQDESVLDSIERSAGIRARILLHDGPDDASPILRIGADAESAKEDTRYQVLGEIARGGVGVVFKGRDKNLGRSVALKVLRARHADNPEVMQRFLEEAQIGGQLQHPGIVPIYGLGLQEDGRPYFAMKLIRGSTLAELLQDRADPNRARRRFLGVFEQICQTMAYAHSRGVVHRDIKPSNVMVGHFGEVQIVDWGFAKVLGREEEQPDVTMIATVRTEGEGSDSIAGSIMGTPAYMPPEQAMGQIDMLDERSDVFALGALLCELLTGLPPYVGETRDQLLLASQARLDDAHARLDGCGADEELIELCRSCLASTRGERPRTAGALATAVGNHLSAAEERARAAEVAAAEAKAAEAEQAAHEHAATETAQRARRGRMRILTLTAAVLLVAVGAGITYAGMQSAKRDREAAATREINAELATARRLLGEGRWDDALRAARAAMAFAETGKVAGARAKQTLDVVEAGAERARLEAKRLEGNRAFLAEIASVRDGTARFGIAKLRDEAYVEGFQRFGIDVSGSVEDAVHTLKSKAPDPLLVAGALDHWAALRKAWRDVPEESWSVLLDIASGIDSDPLRIRLRERMKTGEFDAMEEDIAAAKDASYLTALILYRILFGENRAGEALDALRLHVERTPQEFWARHAYGSALWQMDRWREALEQFQAAVALRPDSGGTWNGMGLSFASLGQYEDALRCYGRWEEVAGESWKSLLNRSWVYAHMGKVGEAIAAIEQATALNPKRMDLAMWRGIHLWSDDRTAEAEAWFRKGVELDPSWWNSHHNLAKFLIVQGEFKDALHHARIASETGIKKWAQPVADLAARMIEIEPALSGFLERPLEEQSLADVIEFAHLCYFKGRYDESVRLYREAERRQPDLTLPSPHQYRPAQAAVRAGEVAYALRWMRRAIAREAERIPTLDRMGRYHAGQSLNQLLYRDGGFKSVRREVADSLPDGAEWTKFWDQVEALMWRSWEDIGG